MSITIKHLPSEPKSVGEEKFYINVPYAEKNLAKENGAKWDPQKKSWFIPREIDHIYFQQWIKKENISETSDNNIRSSGFFVAESLEFCWKCKLITPVFAFLLPENHTETEYDEDEEKTIWVSADYKTFISFTDTLSEQPKKIIGKFSSHYYFDFSKKSSSGYYMNHCKNCGSKLGDFYMHSEPGGAFDPMTPKEASKIKLYWHNELFEASVGTYSIDINHYEHMQIITII
jgi:hypothetical protein